MAAAGDAHSGRVAERPAGRDRAAVGGRADRGADVSRDAGGYQDREHQAARLETLCTEQAYVVLAAARRLEAAGHKVVHLEIGEPDMPTPPHVVEAGVRALRDGLTRYALAAGVPELREAIARSLAARG